MRTIILIRHIDWFAVVVVTAVGAVLGALRIPEAVVGWTFWYFGGVVAAGAQHAIWYGDDGLSPGLDSIAFYLLGLLVMGGFFAGIGAAIGLVPFVVIGVEEMSRGTMAFLAGIGGFAIVPMLSSRIPPQWNPD